LAKYAVRLHQGRFASLDRVRQVVGATPHLDVADRIAERSITLAKDSLRVVPLTFSAASRPRVLSVTVAVRTDLAAGTTLDVELRRSVDVRSEWVDGADPGAAVARVAPLADSADVVIVGSYLGQGTRVADANAPSLLVDLVRAVVQRNPRTIVVAFGNPYFYQQVPFTPTYLVAWGGFPVSQRAAARALLGLSEISGRLPVSIPPALRLGDGARRELRAAR
jgi:beta-N-acetylhexosaminidase